MAAPQFAGLGASLGGPLGGMDDKRKSSAVSAGPTSIGLNDELVDEEAFEYNRRQ